MCSLLKNEILAMLEVNMDFSVLYDIFCLNKDNYISMFSHQEIMQFSLFDFKTSLPDEDVLPSVEFMFCWARETVANSATSLTINYLC